MVQSCEDVASKENPLLPLSLHFPLNFKLTIIFIICSSVDYSDCHAVSPTKTQALSLYSLCQETDSLTPRLASRSFSSFISFTFVRGLKTHREEKVFPFQNAGS